MRDAIGWVTCVNHALNAGAFRPTRESTVQVELARQRFSVIPTLAWYASTEREDSRHKQFLIVERSAFRFRCIRSLPYYSHIGGEKWHYQTKRTVLRLTESRLSSPRLKAGVSRRGLMIELLREKRYDAITVQDLLDRAGIGRSTFYTHYFDKEDVLASVSEQMLELFRKPLSHRDAGD